MTQTLHFSAIEQAILKTLIYGDIFDFPLTFEEIYTYLICSKQIDKNEIQNSLPNLITKKIVVYNDGFYFLAGREPLVAIRKKRKIESGKKIAILKKNISYLSVIPTIRLIGISGNVAIQSAEEDDDIDLFIIAQKNRIWITRLLILIVLQVLGKRRERNQIQAKDTFCINMVMDENALSTSEDLYTAHEIVQMVPVFDRNETYKKFISSNTWVVKFLANSLFYSSSEERSDESRSHSVNLEYKSSRLALFARTISFTVFYFFESFAKKIQLWYMKKHVTRETLSETLIAFHPIDYRTRILNKYKLRLKKYL